jgi:outer membrane protein assembly factor BamA
VKLFITIYLILSFYFLSCVVVFAQQEFKLTIKSSSKDTKILTKVAYPDFFQDSLQGQAILHDILVQLRDKSFLASSFDSIFWKDSILYVSLEIGNKYQWIELRENKTEELKLKKQKHASLYQYDEVKARQEELLNHLENHGYPFAAVWLDSIEVHEQNIKASLNFEQGTYVYFDTLLIEGETNINREFLSNYLDIEQKKPFSEKKIQYATKLLKQLPYLTLEKPITVIFKNDRAYPVIKLKKRPSNQFDGIIGFLPNQEQENKILLTGELDLKLRNPFGRGKYIAFEWQQVQKASPKLDFTYEHPNFLKLRIDVKFDFNLLKQDTTFFSSNTQLSLAYTKPWGKVSFITGIKNNRVLTTIQNQENLSPYADSKFVSSGLVYEWQNLDDYWYPRKGWQVEFGLKAGNKTINTNPNVVADLYEDLDLKSLQAILNFSIKKHLKTGKQTSLLLSSEGAFIENKNLFLTDLFRLGGLKNLRGFNQNFFFADKYLINTAEIRLYTDKTSYLFAFANQGFVSYDLDLIKQSLKDNVFGFGAGISFATKAGVFNFVYAMGKSDTQNLEIKQAKIHFGLLSKF